MYFHLVPFKNRIKLFQSIYFVFCAYSWVNYYPCTLPDSTPPYNMGHILLLLHLQIPIFPNDLVWPRVQWILPKLAAVPNLAFLNHSGSEGGRGGICSPRTRHASSWCVPLLWAPLQLSHWDWTLLYIPLIETPCSLISHNFYPI